MLTRTFALLSLLSLLSLSFSLKAELVQAEPSQVVPSEAVEVKTVIRTLANRKINVHNLTLYNVLLVAKSNIHEMIKEKALSDDNDINQLQDLQEVYGYAEQAITLMGQVAADINAGCFANNLDIKVSFIKMSNILQDSFDPTEPLEVKPWHIREQVEIIRTFHEKIIKISTRLRAFLSPADIALVQKVKTLCEILNVCLFDASDDYFRTGTWDTVEDLLIHRPIEFVKNHKILCAGIALAAITAVAAYYYYKSKNTNTDKEEGDDLDAEDDQDAPKGTVAKAVMHPIAKAIEKNPALLNPMKRQVENNATIRDLIDKVRAYKADNQLHKPLKDLLQDNAVLDALDKQGMRYVVARQLADAVRNNKEALANPQIDPTLNNNLRDLLSNDQLTNALQQQVQVNDMAKDFIALVDGYGKDAKEPLADVINKKLFVDEKGQATDGQRAQEFVSQLALELPLAGLRNNGNTCFMNSTLQCLLNQPELIDYVKAHQGNNPIAKDFVGLAKRYHKQRGDRVNPEQFVKKVLEQYFNIKPGQRRPQQDAHEFLTTLADGTNQTAGIFGNDAPLAFDIKTVRECPDCKHPSETKEAAKILEVPISGDNDKKGDLKDCLENYFTEEILTGDNKITCSNSKCAAKVNPKTRSVMENAPSILAVMLKRFAYDRTEKKFSKITRPIAIPYQDFTMDKLGADKTRDLSGIVLHAGGYGGGHYTAFVKDPVTNTWNYCNDSRTRSATDAEVQQVCQEGVYAERFTPFLLFYREKPQTH